MSIYTEEAERRKASDYRVARKRDELQRPAPRVVAECWTCSGSRWGSSGEAELAQGAEGGLRESGRPVSLSSDQVGNHRAAGHDVRPVQGEGKE